MNFILLEFVSIEGLSRLGTFQESVKVPEGYLGEYAGMLGVYAYVKLDTIISADESVITTRLQTRMFDGTLEDPATGSAACAIGSYLAMTIEGRARVRVFEIVQGVEMGRRSEILVRVTLADGGAVNKVELEGGTVGVMESFGLLRKTACSLAGSSRGKTIKGIFQTGLLTTSYIIYYIRLMLRASITMSFYDKTSKHLKSGETQRIYRSGISITSH